MALWTSIEIDVIGEQDLTTGVNKRVAFGPLSVTT
jgi:hypothetical protein